MICRSWARLQEDSVTMQSNTSKQPHMHRRGACGWVRLVLCCLTLLMRLLLFQPQNYSISKDWQSKKSPKEEKQASFDIAFSFFS
jgi:hypothetical protein